MILSRINEQMETSPDFILDRDFSKFKVEERVALLRDLWQRVYSILETFCGGYLGISSNELNLKYVKICLIIERILEGGDDKLILSLKQKYMRPFESLHEHWGEGGMWWNEGGMQQFTLDFKAAIDEAFILLGEPKIIDPITTKFLREVDEYLIHYAETKKATEHKWLEDIDKAAAEFKQNSQDDIVFHQKAKGKLGFLKE